MAMSSLNATPENAQRVLTILTENPGIDVESIAEHAGKSVHWARVILRALANQKLIRIELDPSPNAGPNKRIYFAARKPNSLPPLTSQFNTITPQQFLEQLSKTNYKPSLKSATKALQDTGIVMLRIFREAGRLAVGEKPQAAANRSQWRATLQQSAAQFQYWQEIIESILSTPDWWAIKSLEDIGRNPWVQQNLSIQRCDQLIAAIQAAQNAAE